MDKSITLQKAKLTYIENNPNELSHSFFWAAYNIIGKTCSIVKK